MSKEKFQSNIPIHPGESIAEMLETVGMSQTDLAERTGLTVKTVNEIIQGKNSVTPETALKLAAVFGMSADYWNNKERRYQETISRMRMQEKLQEEEGFLKEFSCYKELSSLKLVEDVETATEKVKQLLAFFGVSSLDYIKTTHAIAFRKAKKDRIDENCLAAWLRAGELKARDIETKPFDKDKLASIIPVLRKLSTKSPTIYGTEIKNLLAECGVAVVYLPYFKNTYVHGATRWLSPETALVQLSLFLKWDDVFWFSLMHELGHIVKHGKKEEFLEFHSDSDTILEDKEREADEFAQKSLISETEFKKLLGVEPEAIKALAREIGIAPSIVAGRVAHEFSKRGNNNVWRRYTPLRTKLTISSS